MCGICGVWDFRERPVEPDSLLTMMRAMEHRGPDDQGHMVDGAVGLGHVRLSIIDLSSAGHQPMVDREGRYAIVYNGEIYNYIEIKAELEALGHRFQSQTDTEVLLYAFIEWGEQCLHKLNGMFAFVVYDKTERSLFGARDRFGIKPFYYFLTAERFGFASDLSALKRAYDKTPQPNDAAIYDYLMFNRTDHDDTTFFSGIKKLQHGNKFWLSKSGLTIKPWYDLRSRIDRPFASKEEFNETLASAIQLRLRSDVPIGVCLSGGLDSSSIVSFLSGRFGLSDVNTFSAVYDRADSADESVFIDLFRPYLKNMHFAYPTADTLFADLENFLAAHSEPFPTTAIYAQYKVMELARGHVKVTLDGQGADEQLAGYHYFFGHFYKELLQSFRWVLLSREVVAYLRIHKSADALKFLLFLLLPSILKQRAMMGKNNYIHHQFVAAQQGEERVSEQLYAADSLNDALIRHFEFKLEHLLKWEDCNSMWFSIESRIPFLDYRLVEKTLAYPSTQVIENGYTKAIFRKAVEGIVPDAIRLRTDKKGFETPGDRWFRTPQFREFILDILHSASIRSRGYFDAAKLLRAYDRHLKGEINIARDIWKWINLEIWLNQNGR